MTKSTQTTAGFGYGPDDFVAVHALETKLDTTWSKDVDGDIWCTSNDQAKTLSAEVMTVDSMDSFEAVLRRLQGCPHTAHIRAGIQPGVNLASFRRSLHRHTGPNGLVREPTLIDVPRRYVLFDIHGIPTCDDWFADMEAATAVLIEDQFPPGFYGNDFIAIATASAGMKPGMHLRLGFLFEQPMYGHEIERLMRDAPVNTATLRPEQLICTAAPSFIGLTDPISQRIVRSWHDDNQDNRVSSVSPRCDWH